MLTCRPRHPEVGGIYKCIGKWLKCGMQMHRTGRRGAFNLVILGWLPAGMLFALASLYLAKDETAMQVRSKMPAFMACFHECSLGLVEARPAVAVFPACWD